MLGLGSSKFSAAANFKTDAGPLAIGSGDFNGDGKADIITPNYTNSTVSVLLGDASGVFTSSGNFAVGLNPYF